MMRLRLNHCVARTMDYMMRRGKLLPDLYKFCLTPHHQT